MPSWSSIWISGVVVANVFGFILTIYAWEHAFGLVSAFKKKPKQKKLQEDDDEAPEFKAKLKRDESRRRKQSQQMEAVAIDIKDTLSLFPVVLAWEDVQVKVYTGDATAFKTVIHKCSGMFLPSEFVAIMGPSGAGKSSMLDILAGRKTGQGLEGAVKLNGLQINPTLANRCISYVGQEDVFMPMLTVWESLLFVAELRVKPDPDVSLTNRMNVVLETLGMARIRNSKVGGYLAGGTEVRGISGGEKRRLSIACGLVGNPSVLFLDEPTTGLDSHAALAVMKYLNSLTQLGHTIVSTIHQPRQEIFASFDKILVLSEGYQMFFASPEYILPWFRDILGIPYRKEVDGTVADWLLGAIAVQFQTSKSEDGNAMVTAEHIKAASERFKEYVKGIILPDEDLDELPHDRKLVDVGTAMSEIESSDDHEDSASDTQSRSPLQDGTAINSSTGHTKGGVKTLPTHMSREELVAGIQKSDQNPSIEESLGNAPNRLGDSKRLYARGWTTQFWVLFKRFMLQQLRNPTEAGMRLLTANWSGIFFGLVWIRLPNDANSAQQRLSLIFFCLMMYSMVPFAYMAFPAADKRFFKLDSAKGLYSPSAYFLAYNVANAPFLMLNSWATGIVIYGLTGLRYEWWAIIQFNIILGLHGLISNQLLVFTIWWFEGQDSAFSVATIYITFSLLICGFYIRIKDMTLSVIRGLTWASYCKYTFQALAYTELEDRTWDPEPCNNNTAVAPGFAAGYKLCQFPTKQLLEYYDFLVPTSKSTVAMLAIYIFVSGMCFWALLRIYKKKPS